MTPAPRTFTLGRDGACDLPLADDSISARHAELTFLGDGRLLLTDCRSTNGTFLVGADGQERPVRQALVSPGDHVRLGAVTLDVRALLEALRLKTPRPASASPSPPADAPAPPWARSRRLLRCGCGGVKAAEAPCPECGQ